MKIFVLMTFLLFPVFHSFAQITIYPYKESFDTVAVPLLPFGWTTTVNKNISGDFSTTTTSVRTSPHAASSTDATKFQSLISPRFDFTGKIVDSLEFFERRTASHLAKVVVEASINNDTTYNIRISPDSLRFVSSTSYTRRIFALPEALSGKQNVRFRIKIIADTSGNSGVYRVDDVRLTVKRSKDLALNSVSCTPAVLYNGDQISAAIVIKNKALSGNFSGSIQLYDSLSIISSQDFSNYFGTNDSINVVIQYLNVKAGRHLLKAVLVMNGDEDSTNNMISTVVTAGYRQRTMLINEVMYAPSSGMPEWVEIVNNSSDTIPITGWKISDAGATRSLLAPSQRNILPNSYFIVTTDTNSFKYFYTTDAQLFQSNFSSLNNSGDAVVFYDNTGTMIDSLMYLSSWGGSTGRSLERIDTSLSSIISTNWRTSNSPSGATPGMINSISKKAFDAAAGGITISPRLPSTGNSITISTVAKNIGRLGLTLMNVQFYIDMNKDSILTLNELRFQQMIHFLAPSDSVVVQMRLDSLPQGLYRLFIKLSPAQDDDSTNNISLYPISIGVPIHSIAITEIMYAPLGDIPEWVEASNTNPFAITVSGWKISDNGSTRSFIQSAQPMVGAHSFFIITTDTIQFKNYYSSSSPLFQAAIPSLNNTTADAAVLFDERGQPMDSVCYNPAWGGSSGQSLQRFDPYSASTDSANWRTAWPSPGSENSIARKNFDAAIKDVRTTRLSNGSEITAIIVNEGRWDASAIGVQFFVDANHDSLAENEELLYSSLIPILIPFDSASVTYHWDSVPNGKQTIIVMITPLQDDRVSNNILFSTIKNNFPSQSFVINEIMFEPRTGDAEFVELMNRSTDTIDIADWKLMDQPGSTGNRTIVELSTSVCRIAPNGYVLIASDSSLFVQFPSLKARHVVIHSSLSLSNSGEDLVLTDLTNTQIDSVRYSPEWHLKNLSTSGRSIERINPSTSTNDSRNWSSSVAPGGSSPLQKNSIFLGTIALSSTLTLTPNPFSPDHDGFEDFLAINYSLPVNSSTIRIRIYDVAGRMIRRLAQGEPSSSIGSVVWNGMDDDGNRVRIGMYIILFEALDNFGGVAQTMKSVAVVGRKL